MRRKNSRAKSGRSKIKLGLPELEYVKAEVLNSLRSLESQRSYQHSIDEFVDWYCSSPRLSFNNAVVTRYRIHLEDRHLAPGTINVRLAAIRRLAYDSGLLSPDLAAGIRRVKGSKKLGFRLGNWLTADEARQLWQLPDPFSLKGKRDRDSCNSIRLRLASRRVDRTEPETHPTARRALGHRRSDWKGWPRPNHSDARLG
jgi:hypothetical protein